MILNDLNSTMLTKFWIFKVLYYGYKVVDFSTNIHYEIQQNDQITLILALGVSFHIISVQIFTISISHHLENAE